MIGDRFILEPELILYINTEMSEGLIFRSRDKYGLRCVGVDTEDNYRGKIYNGTTSYIDLGADKPTDLTGDINISARINPTTKGEGNSGNVINNGKLLIRDTANINPYIVFTSNGGINYSFSGNDISYGSWQHIMVTRKSAGIANFYINGVLSGTAEQDSGTPVAGTNNTFIGNAAGAISTFDGIIGLIVIVSRIKSYIEITRKGRIRIERKWAA